MSRTPAPAITHADLAPRPRGLDLGSKAGALLTILCILCGLLCFVLSLFAEATRSQVMWVLQNNGDQSKGKGDYECVYSESGKVPLICASIAFVTLAFAMLMQHLFLLVALSKTETPVFLSWEGPHSSMNLKSHTWQATFFFFSTCRGFLIGNSLSILSIGARSAYILPSPDPAAAGHLTDWWTPRSSCLAIRQGVFAGAGVFSLLSVFLAAGLYATMLRVQWLCQEQENTRQEVLEASNLYASPPTSPHHQRQSTTQDSLSNETAQNPTVQTSSMLLSLYKAALNQKQATFV